MLARIRKAAEEREGGFTLIELLVVIIIIGILAAIAIPVFLNQRQKGYDSQAKSDLRNAATAEETYMVEAQTYSTDAPRRLATPRIVNLITDPHEREPISLPHLHSWTATHFNRILGEFHASLRREPLTPAGAPLDHVPAPPAG